MRHEERIAKMLSEALTRMQPDSGISCQVREIMLMIEERGVYGLADDMIAAYGRYRLSDCSTEELAAIRSALTEAVPATGNRRAVMFYALGSGKTLSGFKLLSQAIGRGSRLSEGSAAGR